MQRFIRDMPKYERSNEKNQEWLGENELNENGEREGSDELAGRQSIEDVLAMKGKGNGTGADSFADYEPVLYQIVKDKQAQY